MRGASDLPVSFDSADTLYVGGGTPSLLEPAALERIMHSLHGAFFKNWLEATLEADPETITPENARAWRRMGFNRVSLGVQSFHDGELRAAGRLHRREDIFTAFEWLRAAGFANLSADLIIGLPHQTEVTWRESLEELVALHPEHISIYLLEVDEESRLGREVLGGGFRYGARAIPDEDSQARFYEIARERLGSAGYQQYEISNWARMPGPNITLAPEGMLPHPGDVESYEDPFDERRILSAALFPPTAPKERAGGAGGDYCSQHNLKYWRREAYLGLGAGAHSFDGASRWANTHNPAAYVAAIQQGRLPREQFEALSPQQALDEELFLGLRLTEGVDVSALETKYNISLRPRLQALAAEGWLEISGSRVRIAPPRLAVSNEVFVQLMGAQASA
jgi:oxygen-independent coproporphyrinogen-3 oxidase